MKISFVFPRLKTYSGAEHWLFRVTEEAVHRGHEVQVVTRGLDTSCLGQLEPEVEVDTLGLGSRLTGHHLVDSLFDSLLSPLLAPRVWSDCDAVMYWGPPTLPALWRRRHRPEVGLYYCLQPPRFAYDLMSEATRNNGLIGRLVPLVAIPYRWLDRRLVRHASRTYAISEAYARWCEELYRLAHVPVLHAGAELNVANQARTLAAPDPLTLITVNKLIPRKNVEVFLQTVARVAEAVPDVRGVVVGHGPSYDHLIAVRNDLGLRDRVEFTGFVPDHLEVLVKLASAAVHLFLERRVPFGMTVVEAGLCGVPSIAVRGGGAEETVAHGISGYLVDESLDIDEITQRAVALLRDPALRDRMAKGAADHARNFTSEVKTAAILDEIETRVRQAKMEQHPRRRDGP